MKNIQNKLQIKLKAKQKEILKLLYRFHYLNRIQIQTLLKHRLHHRILVWLNELTKERYIARDFERKFGNIPAVYCLDIKAREILEKEKDVKPSLLRRVYQDRNNSLKYKTHLVFLADIYLSLTKFAKINRAKLSFYTKTDLYKTKHLIYPCPDAYFAIKDKNKNIKRYFLDIFDPSKKMKWPHKRIIQYFDYYDKETWQENTNKLFPEIILVCVDEEDEKDLNDFIKKQMNYRISDIYFYLTTWDEIKNGGMNRQVLHKIGLE